MLLSSELNKKMNLTQYYSNFYFRAYFLGEITPSSSYFGNISPITLNRRGRSFLSLHLVETGLLESPKQSQAM